MNQEKQQETLDYLEGYLAGLGAKYPIAYKNLLERINVKRGDWPQELVIKVDSQLQKYEGKIKGEL